MENNNYKPDYRIVTDIGTLRTLLPEDMTVVAFDFETAPDEPYRDEPRAALDPHKSHVVGVSFSTTPGSAFYVPLVHKIGVNVEDQDEIQDFLKSRVYLNRKVTKVCHNMAFESSFLYKDGIVLQPPVYDTIAGSQLTLKAPFEFRTLHDSGLKKLATELCDAEMPSFTTVTDGCLFDEMDPANWETTRYACADSDYTLQLYYIQRRWFDENLPGHDYVASTLESPAAVYVGMMRYNGILMDRALMEEKLKLCEEKRNECRHKLNQLDDCVDIGENASTRAFRDWLYETQGLPILVRTDKDQPSMDDEAMVLLKEWCEEHRPELVRLFDLVLEYRKWSKLKTTYLDGYTRYINDVTGRIHPDLLPLKAATGRFACQNPNCFDDQTEVLTHRGFVPFSALTEDDEVAQWESGNITYVKPTAVICQEYDGEMVVVKNKHIDLMMTPDHRCVLQNPVTGQFYVVPASNYIYGAKQLNAAQYHFGDIHLSESEYTLLAATLAVGRISDHRIVFKLSSAEKLHRLMKTVEALGIDYRDHYKSGGKVVITLQPCETVEKIIDTIGQGSTLGEWALDLDRETVMRMLYVLTLFDDKYTGRTYDTASKQSAEWMQILHTLLGFRSRLTTITRKGNAVVYHLDVDGVDATLTADIGSRRTHYNGTVYCVTVPSGFIVVRRNGKVSITGNCQNAPAPGQDEIGVRNFMVAPEGWSLLEVDYSQAEIRLVAYLAQDEVLLDAYRHGEDVHAITTSAVFNIPLEEAKDKSHPDYKHRRTIAKGTMFGIMYGIGGPGLARNLHTNAGVVVSVDEANNYIQGILSKYRSMAAWQKSTKRSAFDNCFVETALGRRRYLPDIRNRDRRKRASAERMAINTPVQGLGADLLKLSMGRLVESLVDKPYIRPILTVHDSLVFEVRDDKLAEAAELVKSCMEAPPELEGFMPLVAEAAYGKRYGEMRE